MAFTAYSGPLLVFGQASQYDYNSQLGPSLVIGDVGVLDPRSQFTYQPGSDVSSPCYGWAGGFPSQTVYGVPATKSATLIAAAASVTTGTAMTLASSTTTGLAVGVTVNRQDTNVAVTGLLEIDPLTTSVTANVTSGSNILTVTAVGTGTAYHPFGLVPGTVLTDATHASAIPTGTTITGYISGSGGVGTYTMSANAASTQTGDTVTALYTAFPHAIPCGSSGTVNLWNPNALLSRVLIVTCNNASGTGGVIQVNSLDVFGFPVTENITITPGSALTTTGLKAHKYIKSVIPQFTDGTYTYAIGTVDTIGFPIRSDKFQTGAQVDIALMANNAAVTSTTGYTAAVVTTATATTGDVRGTYALQTPANGTLAVSVNQAPLAPNLASATGMYGVSQYTAW